jgi:hypothetical protein
MRYLATVLGFAFCLFFGVALVCYMMMTPGTQLGASVGAGLCFAAVALVSLWDRFPE